MNPSTKQLYLFLTACSGNWRSSIYISCREKDDPGYLLSADRDGEPIIMPVARFQQLTGELIDPTECCGLLTTEALRSLYAQYLLWRYPTAQNDSLHLLSQGSPL